MRLVRFACGNEAHLGIRVGDEVVDLTTAAPDLPGHLGGLLALGPEALHHAGKTGNSADVRRLNVADLRLLPPAGEIGKILCLGLNYVDHVAESHLGQPDFPSIFLRAASSLVGAGQPLIVPRLSGSFDFEGELVAIVGRTARHVPKEAALSVIAGYSVFNDASVRDYQMRTSQWTIGKNFDGTGGFGPDFVSADTLPPGAAGLTLETRLNGVAMQHADTRDMLFDVADAVSLLSACMTLSPGDVLVMGTPAGVGMARTPPLWMKPGDVCEVEIEGVGLLRNPVTAEAG